RACRPRTARRACPWAWRSRRNTRRHRVPATARTSPVARAPARRYSPCRERLLAFLTGLACGLLCWSLGLVFRRLLVLLVLLVLRLVATLGLFLFGRSLRRLGCRRRIVRRARRLAAGPREVVAQHRRLGVEIAERR